MESLTVTGIEMGEGESKTAQLITTINSKVMAITIYCRVLVNKATFSVLLCLIFLRVPLLFLSFNLVMPPPRKFITFNKALVFLNSYSLSALVSARTSLFFYSVFALLFPLFPLLKILDCQTCCQFWFRNYFFLSGSLFLLSFGSGSGSGSFLTFIKFRIQFRIRP
jgi:hypothetical protein